MLDTWNPSYGCRMCYGDSSDSSDSSAIWKLIRTIYCIGIFSVNVLISSGPHEICKRIFRNLIVYKRFTLNNNNDLHSFIGYS